MHPEFLKSMLENPASSHIVFFDTHVSRRHAFGECVDTLNAEKVAFTPVFMDYSIKLHDGGGRIHFASVPYKNELMKFAGIRPRSINVDHCSASMAASILEFFASRMERRSK